VQQQGLHVLHAVSIIVTPTRSPRAAAPRITKVRRTDMTPYASATTTGLKARQEITKVLRRFGCEKLGFMDDDANHEVLLHFEHRGRAVQLRASAKGWAQLWLKDNPLSYRARKSKYEHEQEALKKGHVAVNSMLRDWIKGQVTAVECGILSFEAVFMPFILTHDGRPLIERVSDLLPKPDEPRVVEFKGPGLA
jgi:hypothetical protein